MSIVHKCPVCEGSGKVIHNFYKDKSGIGLTEECRFCKGSGVLWDYYDYSQTTFPQIIYPVEGDKLYPDYYVGTVTCKYKVIFK